MNKKLSLQQINSGTQHQELILSKKSWLDFNSDFFCVCLVTIIVIAFNAVWFLSDHHCPSQDEAEHLMNSIAFKDLLIHCRPFSHHWWYQCFAINKFYPPFAYFVNGSFLLVFGQSRLIAQMAILFFTALAANSVMA